MWPEPPGWLNRVFLDFLLRPRRAVETFPEFSYGLRNRFFVLLGCLRNRHIHLRYLGQMFALYKQLSLFLQGKQYLRVYMALMRSLI